MPSYEDPGSSDFNIRKDICQDVHAGEICMFFHVQARRT